jgi:hypothetical protein
MMWRVFICDDDVAALEIARENLPSTLHRTDYKFTFVVVSPQWAEYVTEEKKTEYSVPGDTLIGYVSVDDLLDAEDWTQYDVAVVDEAIPSESDQNGRREVLGQAIARCALEANPVIVAILWSMHTQLGPREISPRLIEVPKGSPGEGTLIGAIQNAVDWLSHLPDRIPLVIDTRSRTAVYQGRTLNIQDMPFELLVILAKQVKSAYEKAKSDREAERLRVATPEDIRRELWSKEEYLDAVKDRIHAHVLALRNASLRDILKTAKGSQSGYYLNLRGEEVIVK